MKNTSHILEFTTPHYVRFLLRLIPCPESGRAMVEFYDRLTRQKRRGTDETITEDGVFITRYLASTLKKERFLTEGLRLHADFPEWDIDPTSFATIREWIDLLLLEKEKTGRRWWNIF